MWAVEYKGLLQLGCDWMLKVDSLIYLRFIQFKSIQLSLIDFKVTVLQRENNMHIKIFHML